MPKCPKGSHCQKARLIKILSDYNQKRTTFVIIEKIPFIYLTAKEMNHSWLRCGELVESVVKFSPFNAGSGNLQTLAFISGSSLMSSTTSGAKCGSMNQK